MPHSLTEASLRIKKNYIQGYVIANSLILSQEPPYFRINYLSLVANVIAISLILLLALLAAWLFLYLFSLVRPASRPHATHFFERETLGILTLLTIGII